MCSKEFVYSERVYSECVARQLTQGKLPACRGNSASLLALERPVEYCRLTTRSCRE